MKEKRLIKNALYTLLCVCVFIIMWGMCVIAVGDINYLSKSSVPLKLAHILVGSFGCFTIITIMEGIKKTLNR